MPFIRPQTAKVCKTGRGVLSDLEKLRQQLVFAKQQVDATRDAAWAQAHPGQNEAPPMAFEHPERIGRVLNMQLREMWGNVERSNKNTFLSAVDHFNTTVETTINEGVAEIRDLLQSPNLPPADRDQLTELLKAYENYQKAAKVELARLKIERDTLARIMAGPIGFYAALEALSGLDSGSASVASKAGSLEALITHRQTGSRWWKSNIQQQRDQEGNVIAIRVNFGGMTEKFNSKDRDAAALGIAAQAMAVFGDVPVVITGVEKDPKSRDRMITALMKVGYKPEQIFVQTRDKDGKIEDTPIAKLLDTSSLAGITREVGQYNKDMEAKYGPTRTEEKQKGAVEQGINDVAPGTHPDIPATSPLQRNQECSKLVNDLYAIMDPNGGGVTRIFGRSSVDKRVENFLRGQDPGMQAQMFTRLYDHLNRWRAGTDQCTKVEETITKMVAATVRNNQANNVQAELLRMLAGKQGADLDNAYQVLNRFEALAGLQVTQNPALNPR